MRALTALISLTLLCGCGSDGPGLQPAPSPTPLAAPAWETPVQVADAGPGYPVGTLYHQTGGPRWLSVDPAGNAFLAASHAGLVDPSNRSSTRRQEAWASAFGSGQGWSAPVRLSAGAGVGNDDPNGIGLTPDGALFGWVAPVSGGRAFGLRGFATRTGWQPAGTLMTDPASTTSQSFATTDSTGTPSLVYLEGNRTLAVRHTGVLGSPETVFDVGYPTALAADGAARLAVARYDRTVALRLPDGRWLQTAAPAGDLYTRLSLAGRPTSGFVAAWAELAGNEISYFASSLDASGSWGPPTLLFTVAPPFVDPRFHASEYDPAPRLAVGADGGAVVAWRTRTELIVSRETGGSWEPIQAVPNATPAGAPAPALDRNGTLLLLWPVEGGGLVSAQRARGQSWSPTSRLTTSSSPVSGLTIGGSDPLLAMNGDGTAFAAWRDGERVMAARSPRR